MNRTLFEQTEINGLAIRNRFVRSATWTGLATEDGDVTPRLVEKMVELAAGGVGLIITGHAYVQKRGQAGPWQLGIHDDRLVPGLRQLSDTVHGRGGKIVMQLAHAGIYAPASLIGTVPAAVSDINTLVPHETRCLTINEIKELVVAFGRAAKRAKSAGFDGVQIHAAHGYLLNQFLSPGYNVRQDAYGGTPNNRAAMLLAVIRQVRQAVGSGYPVMVKLNAQDFFQGGLDLSESIRAGVMFEEAGIDALEISGGTRLSGKLKSTRTGILSESDEAYYEKESRAFRKHLTIPLILVGGIRSYGVAERLIREQIADYIALCRPLIREPDLVNRWKSGNHTKAACISDNCCLESGLKGNGVHCISKTRSGGA